MNGTKTGTEVIGRLSYVLPVTLREDVAGAWRNDPNRGVRMRLRLLVASFLRHGAPGGLDRFLILSPADQHAELAALLPEIAGDTRFEVVDERAVCQAAFSGAGPEGRRPSGWVIQQLLKLAAADRVRTEYYVTLDSDIVCLAPFGPENLICGDRAWTNTESVDDYLRLYTDDFAAREFRVKQRRMANSARLLGYVRPPSLAGRCYGETPVVLHAPSVRALCRHLDLRSNAGWATLLAGTRGWTEYGLYFQYLEMSGALERYHALAGPNRVLNLARSVWHASPKYRMARRYDRDHFRIDPARIDSSASGEGPFVAIQSWLKPQNWLGSVSLPPGVPTGIIHFYRALASWLGYEFGRELPAGSAHPDQNIPPPHQA